MKKEKILLDWKKYNNIDEVKNNEDDIRSIFQNDFVGLTLSNALTSSACQKLSKSILNNNFDIFGNSEFGRVYGKKLNENHSGNFQNVKLEDYNINSLKYLNWLKEEVDIDIEAELIKIFQKFSRIKKISVPKKLEIEFLPATLRVCNPKKGGITHHVGNEFIKKLPESKLLEDTVILQNQLSFFIIIQEPDLGGELVVYPKTYDDYKNDSRDRSDLIREMESLPQLILPPKVGDLIIFQGGHIWHKVSDVEGDNDRITLGGIMSFTKDKTEIKFWS